MFDVKKILAVEIEVNTRCNKRCNYCPVSVLPKIETKEMDQTTFSKVIDRLKEIKYEGRISYHFYSEPLLRKDLERLVTKVARTLPECQQVLFTNGDYLTEQRFNALLHAGISMVVITSHDGRAHPPRKFQYVQTSDDLELTNRGGVIAFLPRPENHVLRSPCYAPSEMIIITVNGDVLLCYEDAKRENIVGNILRQTLPEILNSEFLSEMRKHLEVGNRLFASDMCRRCNNVAHQLPGRSNKSEPFWNTL